MNYSREAVEKGGPPERRLRTADADQKTTEKLEKTCGGICTLRFNIINFSQESEIRNREPARRVGVRRTNPKLSFRLRFVRGHDHPFAEKTVVANLWLGHHGAGGIDSAKATLSQ